MTGQLSGNKRKRFMQAWKISGVHIWLLALILLAVTTPVYAAMQPVRALHFVVFNLSVSDAKRLIDEASKEKLNTVILGMPWRNGLKLNSTPWVVPDKLTWSRDDLLDVVKYARQKNMEVIPQLPLLSHQELLLEPNSPGLMFNAKTYDPRNEKVYQLVLPIIDEFIELLHPRAIHIGHDEVLGWDEKHFEKGLLKRGEQILPPDLFLDDVKRLHAYLKKKNIETWMWGDMLISPDEFPTIRDKTNINGSSPGYGQTLRRMIPKDIVICDWHYSFDQADFPSLAAFRTDGFRVLGSSWKQTDNIRKFSRYAATHGADGMIATTWWPVQGKEWDVVDRIIRDSGEAFSKDFPDAK